MKKNEFFVFLDFYQLNLCIRDLIDYVANSQNVKKEMFENAKNFFSIAIEPNRPISTFLNQSEIENGVKFFETLKEFYRDTFEDFRYFDFVDNSIKSNEATKIEYYEKIIVIHQSFEFIIKGILKDYRSNNLIDIDIEKLVEIDEEFYRLHFIHMIYQELLNVSSEFNKRMHSSQGKMTLEDQYILNTLKELVSYFYDLKNKYLGNNEELKVLFENALNVLKVMDGTVKKSNEELTFDINSTKNQFLTLGKTIMASWLKLYQGVVGKYQNE